LPSSPNLWKYKRKLMYYIGTTPSPFVSTISLCNTIECNTTRIYLASLILLNHATADTKWELTQNRKWTEGLEMRLDKRAAILYWLVYMQVSLTKDIVIGLSYLEN